MKAGLVASNFGSENMVAPNTQGIIRGELGKYRGSMTNCPPLWRSFTCNGVEQPWNEVTRNRRYQYFDHGHAVDGQNPEACESDC
jgi:hypothetical protein